MQWRLFCQEAAISKVHKKYMWLSLFTILTKDRIMDDFLGKIHMLPLKLFCRANVRSSHRRCPTKLLYSSRHGTLLERDSNTKWNFKNTYLKNICELLLLKREQFAPNRVLAFAKFRDFLIFEKFMKNYGHLHVNDYILSNYGKTRNKKLHKSQRFCQWKLRTMSDGSLVNHN